MRVRNVRHLIGPFATDYRPFSYFGHPRLHSASVNLSVTEHGVHCHLNIVPRAAEASPRKRSARKRERRGVSSIANATLGTSRVVVQRVGRLA